MELFHDVALGLVHAHGKGVLHCDLKPANILLDQDGKPRLADFGTVAAVARAGPRLGNALLHGAEQADLKAVPDARWDVLRARGAGQLHAHRQPAAPHAAGHRATGNGRRPGRPAGRVPADDPKVAPAADRALASAGGSIGRWRRSSGGASRLILTSGSPTCRSVLGGASPGIEGQKGFRPVMIRGALPAPLLAVVSWFAWRGFQAAVRELEQALTRRALKINRFAAMYVVGPAKSELERRYAAVEQVAGLTPWPAVAEVVRQPELARLLDDLSDPQKSEAELGSRCGAGSASTRPASGCKRSSRP